MKPRLRFCPSPTGVPHVGVIRTALFNWAYSKHIGGTFIFRIEDTDPERDSEESYQQLLEAMRWLGLDWDEGVEVGGDFGPYRQSQRMDIYKDVIAKLIASGHAYESFSTAEEIKERHIAKGENPNLGYDGYDRDLSPEQIAKYKAEGRDPVIRFKMPTSGKLEYNDLIRGQIAFAAENVPDYVIARGNGQPLYTLVNPVDDALMGVTHILRGEDLLSSMPRQLVLHQALMDIGISPLTELPLFGHLPYVMGEGNKKLSKRDPQSNIFLYKDKGFLPEGVINYLALLGWSLSADEDIFTVQQLIDNFDIAKVLPNPARFDYKKMLAINATHIRELSEQDFFERVLKEFPYELSDDQQDILLKACPLVQERVQTLGEVYPMVAFLFEDKVQYEEGILEALPENAKEVLSAAKKVLNDLNSSDPESLQQALRSELVDKMGLKPRDAFSPLRAAISGRRVSPPLFESIEILGIETSIQRIEHLISIL